MNYYDAVLLLVPLVFTAAAGAVFALGPAGLAAPVGALAVVPLVGHALFVRAPGADTTTESGSQDTGLQAAD